MIRPGFLAVLGIPAAALGLIEGIADAVASFTKMISGYIADKLGHRKLLVPAFLALVKDPQHSPDPALEFFGSLRRLPTRFKRYLGAVGVFGIGDFSHALLILAATTLLTALAFRLGIDSAILLAGTVAITRVRD